MARVRLCVCVRELVCREGGAGCSPTCTGPVAVHLHFECRVGLLPVWSGCDASVAPGPPLAPPLCVCGEIYLTLPYLASTSIHDTVNILSLRARGELWRRSKFAQIR